MNTDPHPQTPAGTECWCCAWEAAHTLSAQAQCVIAWLHGRHLATPGHEGPPAPETTALADDLLRICATGVVTTNSQPGLDPPAGRQRAFLDGYGPRRLVEHLTTSLRDRGMVTDCWPSTWVLPADGPRHTVTRNADGTPGTHTGRFGLRDVLARAGQEFRFSLDAEAALEGSFSFTFYDPQWGRTRLLTTLAAQTAESWVVAEASADW